MTSPFDNSKMVKAPLPPVEMPVATKVAVRGTKLVECGVICSDSCACSMTDGESLEFI